MVLMKFDNTNSLVVLDDQSNSKKFESFKNIETVNPKIDSSFPTKGTVKIGSGKKVFNMEAENPSYKIDWDWDSEPDGPPKDDEEIFTDFFGEMFFSNNRMLLNKYLLPYQVENNYYGHYVFGKKKYLDSINNCIFNNIRFLYFYAIGKDFLSFIQEKQKRIKFKLPKAINTKNVELLYFSDGQIIDFNKEITAKKFPNLKKLVVDTEIENGGKFPAFENLEELYINNYKTKNKFSFENLKKLRTLVYDGNRGVNCLSLKKLKSLQEIDLMGLTNKDLNDLNGIKNLKYVKIETKNTSLEKKDKVKEILKSENFKFLSKLTKVKILKLSLPFDRYPTTTHNIDPKKLVSLLPKSIEDIYIRIGYFQKDVKKAKLLLNNLISRLTNLKDLLINIQLDPGENLPLDLKILKKLKKLESFHFEFFGGLEPKYKNINTIKYLKNLKDVTIPPECFTDKELIEIYKVHGRNLKIYDDILGDLIKNRKIKVK